MGTHGIGQFFALATAITWALALVLFKRSGERIPPLSLNLYKNTVGLVLMVATMAVAALLGSQPFDVLANQRIDDICILMVSGIIGIAIADTIFFHGLNLCGVGLVAVVDCTYTPFTILFAWLLLAEQLTPFHYLGAALIIGGVFVASRHKVPPDRTRGQIVLGMTLAMIAIATMGFGIVLAKPVLEQADVPLVWATSVRVFAGTGFLALYALLGPRWKENWRVFKPSRVWRVALPGSILGAYLALVFWVAGFKYTYASVAAVLNQTSVIFAAVFAALILKEQFGVRKIVALSLAVIGVLIVTFSEALYIRFL